MTILMGRLQSVQILRFIAAFGVLLLHADRRLGLGAAGVDIFFVISGYIICRISARQQVGEFVVGRLRRIYPIYWICSIPAVLLHLQNGHTAVADLVTSVTLWPVIGDYRFPYLHQGWTLSFEMLFYLGAAVVIWRPDMLRWLLVIYGGALALALTTAEPIVRFIGNPIIAEFLLGAVIARMKPLGRDFGALLIVIALMWFAATIMVAANYIMAEDVIAVTKPARVAIWGPPAGLLLLGILQFEPVRDNPFVAFFAYLGDASYSLYLVHMPLLMVLHFLMPTPIAVCVVLAVAVFVHRYIEAPLLAILSRRRAPKLVAA
jgi:exopolysaccharide production protein ExoZ